jgi:LysW-gamma-L-lysine carboxypeptidase
MTTSPCAASTRPSDNDAIAFLERLVKIYSPSAREQPVAEAIVETMGRLGYDAEIDTVGNAVGRMGRGDRHVLLLGHIDTVPGEIDVRRDGDLLYGRGTVDAKGPFATFVMAAARVGALPDTQVTVVGAVEEEAATSKGAYHVAKAYDRPDYVVIGEPSAWNRITIGYKGRLLIDYHLERPVSHTAGQARGVCEEAVDYWLEIVRSAEAYNRDKTGSFSTLDPSLRDMRSGSDGLQEWVDMHIGLRLPTGLDVDEFVEKARGGLAW